MAHLRLASVLLVLLVAGCADDNLSGMDMAATAFDLGADLHGLVTSCVATDHPRTGAACVAPLSCVYPRGDAGMDHCVCSSTGHFECGNCPWGPGSVYGPPSGYVCTAPGTICEEDTSEYQFFCRCYADGTTQCCKVPDFKQTAPAPGQPCCGGRGPQPLTTDGGTVQCSCDGADGTWHCQ